MPAVMKNVRAMLAPGEHQEDRGQRQAHDGAEGPEQRAGPWLADMVWMRNEKKNTNASGASITTHFRGVPKIGT